MRCLSCKYDLKNLTEHRCPECGRGFDPSDPRTFETPESKRERRRKTVKTVVALIGVLFVGWFIVDWYFVVLPFKGAIDRVLTVALIAAAHTLEVVAVAAIAIFVLYVMRRIRSRCSKPAPLR